MAVGGMNDPIRGNEE